MIRLLYVLLFFFGAIATAHANNSCAYVAKQSSSIRDRCQDSRGPACEKAVRREVRLAVTWLRNQRSCQNDPVVLRPNLSPRQLCGYAQRWLRQQATPLKPALLTILARDQTWPSGMRRILVAAGQGTKRGWKIWKDAKRIPEAVAIKHLLYLTNRMEPTSLKCSFISRRVIKRYGVQNMQRDARAVIADALSTAGTFSEKILILEALEAARRLQ